MQQQGLDIHKLQQVVKTRWLKPQEVLQILQNHELFTVAHKPPQKPPSGSYFLFDRRVLGYFRNDGFEWQKKKNGKTINEAHERLKVNNMEALDCYYARGDKKPSFQRRIYWMLDPAYEHIVLVHYRDVPEGSISVSARNDSSTSNQNGSASRAEVHNFPGWMSDLILPCPNSFSPGSAEEVNSQTVTINNETNSTGGSDSLKHKEALWKLKMQLSLEDKEDSYVIADEVPRNKKHVIFPGIQNGEQDNCTSFEDIFNVLEFSRDHTKETGTHPCPSAIDVLKNSDTWLEEDQLEGILHPASMTPTENQWFQIHEVSPQSAFSSESTKVIVVGDFICNPSHSSWAMLFGDVKVPVEIMQQGVIRCHTPCLNAGKVIMCLIDENGNPCSEAREFEFHEKPTKNMINGNGEPCNEAQDIKACQTPTKSSDELLLLLNYMHILFDGHACEVFSKFSPQLPNPGCGFLVNQMDIMKKTYEQLDPEKTVNSVMELLLNDKFKQWLSSKLEQNSVGDCLLPKQYHYVIHTIAALGYDLVLEPLLSSGVPINYRDANGWTALHWAARFGREDMVVALLTAGAATGALSHMRKTPASIALTYGFKGLSAFLSEGKITAHLDSIESKDKRTHVHGGTDDQLALKDSLGAIQNAMQAAGRIQAAYRVFSFKKRRDNENVYRVRIYDVPSFGSFHCLSSGSNYTSSTLSSFFRNSCSTGSGFDVAWLDDVTMDDHASIFDDTRFSVIFDHASLGAFKEIAVSHPNLADQSQELHQAFRNKYVEVLTRCRFAEGIDSVLGVENFEEEQWKFIKIWPAALEYIVRVLDTTLLQPKQNHVAKNLNTTQLQLLEQNSHACSVFTTNNVLEVAKEPLCLLLSLACQVAKVKKSPEKFFYILCMHKAMSDAMPTLRRVFDADFMKKEVDGIFAEVKDSALGMLHELKVLVKTYSPKKVPMEGSILTVTGYLMKYIRLLLNHTESLDMILSKDQADDLLTAEGVNLMGRLASGLIDALESVLNEKYSTYASEAGLQYLFLMNNAHFILQQVEESDLRLAVGAEWIKKRQFHIKQYIRDYLSSSWKQIVHPLETATSTSPLKRRRNSFFKIFYPTRSPLKSFESALDKTCKSQMHWKVPSPVLRIELRANVIEYVVQAYRAYWDGLEESERGGLEDLEPKLKRKLSELFEG